MENSYFQEQVGENCTISYRSNAQMYNQLFFKLSTLSGFRVSRTIPVHHYDNFRLVQSFFASFWWIESQRSFLSTQTTWMFDTDEFHISIEWNSRVSCRFSQTKLLATFSHLLRSLRPSKYAEVRVQAHRYSSCGRSVESVVGPERNVHRPEASH